MHHSYWWMNLLYVPILVSPRVFHVFRRDIRASHKIVLSSGNITLLSYRPSMSDYRFHNPHDEYDYLGYIDMHPDGSNALPSAAPSSDTDVFDDYMNEFCGCMLSELLY